MTTTKKGNRAGKKTTQLDRIEAMLNSLVNRSAVERDRAIRMESLALDARSTIVMKLDLLTKSPEQEPRVEPWAPKAGALVVVIGKSAGGSERYPIGSVQPVFSLHGDYLAGIGTSNCDAWGYRYTSLRPATPEQIATYEREQAWKGKKTSRIAELRAELERVEKTQYGDELERGL